MGGDGVAEEHVVLRQVSGLIRVAKGIFQPDMNVDPINLLRPRHPLSPDLIRHGRDDQPHRRKVHVIGILTVRGDDDDAGIGMSKTPRSSLPHECELQIDTVVPDAVQILEVIEAQQCPANHGAVWRDPVVVVADAEENLVVLGSSLIRVDEGVHNIVRINLAHVVDHELPLRIRPGVHRRVALDDEVPALIQLVEPIVERLRVAASEAAAVRIVEPAARGLVE